MFETPFIWVRACKLCDHVRKRWIFNFQYSALEFPSSTSDSASSTIRNRFNTEVDQKRSFEWDRASLDSNDLTWVSVHRSPSSTTECGLVECVVQTYLRRFFFSLLLKNGNNKYPIMQEPHFVFVFDDTCQLVLVLSTPWPSSSPFPQLHSAFFVISNVLI